MHVFVCRLNQLRKLWVGIVVGNLQQRSFAQTWDFFLQILIQLQLHRHSMQKRN